MTELAELFAGFDRRWIDTSIGKMFARIGGDGPPLLLLHGYPQTHVMWHRIAPQLAQRFSLIIPDLPGYGASASPAGDVNHAPYDKRSMAGVMVEVMQSLGHEKFRLAGHDRGGRVAYRLALDHPARVERLATLDIIPTVEMWRDWGRAKAMKAYHWTFLAQPAPLPEMLIEKMPVAYLEWKLKSWAGTDAFDPRALEHYRAAFCGSAHIHAHCEDYRAGATVDIAHDEADLAAGRTIDCPMLALWGSSGFASLSSGPLDIWRKWAPKASAQAIDSGHFLPEENPNATATALLEFFSRT